jgi:hypothetical protein
MERVIIAVFQLKRLRNGSEKEWLLAFAFMQIQLQQTESGSGWEDGWVIK